MAAKKTEHDQLKEILLGSGGKPHMMLEVISDYITLVDKDLNVIWVNEITKKHFGEDLVGKKCYEVYHNRKEPCEPYPCHTLEAFQDGKVHERDLTTVDKEGKTRHFHSIANVALKDKEGKPAAVIEITRDITLRKQAEEAKQRSEQKFLKVFDSNAAIMAIGTLEEGCLIDVNKEFLRTYGFKRKEVIGKTVAELNLYKDYFQRDVLTKALKEKGYVHNLEIRALTKKGEVRHVLLSAELMDLGKQKCILTITHDITELKEAEEEIRTTLQEKELLLRELQKQEQWFTTSLQYMSIGVIATDTEGRIQLMNPVAQDFTGQQQSEAEGKSLGQVFRVKNRETGEPVKNPVEQTIRERKTRQIDNSKVFMKKDGTESPISYITTPITDEWDDCAGALLIFQTKPAELALEKNGTLPTVISHIRDEYSKAFAKRPLTKRETEVLQYLGSGKSNKEIAYALKISVRTVEFHRSQIMLKFGVDNVVDLAKIAITLGLTTLEINR